MAKARLRRFAFVAFVGASLVGAACSGLQDRSRAAEGSPSDTPTDTLDERSAGGVVDFSHAMSRAPYYALSDFSLPRDPAGWAAGSVGLVRGEIVRVERGPDRTASFGVIDGVERSLPELTVALHVRVTAVSRGSASELAVGEQVAVVLPYWQGAPEAMPEVAATLRELVDRGLPAGTQAVVAVGSVVDGQVSPSHVVGPLLGEPDGSGVHLAVVPGDGHVWGMNDIDAVFAAAATESA